MTLLLQDFTAVRPIESEAIDYAVKLIRKYEEHDGAYCLASDGSREWGGALDITVGFGPWTAVVTVWLETREDGSTFLYGEY